MRRRPSYCGKTSGAGGVDGKSPSPWASSKERAHTSPISVPLPLLAFYPRLGGRGRRVRIGRGRRCHLILETLQLGLERSELLLADAARLLAQVVEHASVEERTDQGLIKEKLRIELRRFIRKRSGRRPFVLPVIMEI